MNHVGINNNTERFSGSCNNDWSQCCAAHKDRDKWAAYLHADVGPGIVIDRAAEDRTSAG